MTFAHPAAFFLLLPLAVAVAYAYRQGGRRGIGYSVVQWLPRHRSWRATLSAALPAVAALGVVLLIVALARPRSVLERVPQTSEAIAIQMVIDVSGSMNALDMAPMDGSGMPTEDITRLDVVKDTFARFVERRQNDLIGLVSFGGFPYTRSPLTLDHRALLHFLKGITIPRASVQGGPGEGEELMTAIGDALALACARLRDAGTASKIVVLLSDGDSNAGRLEPSEAAAIAAKLGIKVYTVAVGRSGRPPVRMDDGTIRFPFIGFNEQELRRIAAMTGGLHFSAVDPDGLRAALEHIDALETTRIDDTVYLRYRERFATFLWPGALLLFAACALNSIVAKRLL